MNHNDKLMLAKMGNRLEELVEREVAARSARAWELTDQYFQERNELANKIRKIHSLIEDGHAPVRINALDKIRAILSHPLPGIDVSSELRNEAS
jgi:hypothetical protein